MKLKTVSLLENYSFLSKIDESFLDQVVISDNYAVMATRTYLKKKERIYVQFFKKFHDKWLFQEKIKIDVSINSEVKLALTDNYFVFTSGPKEKQKIDIFIYKRKGCEWKLLQELVISTPIRYHEIKLTDQFLVINNNFKTDDTQENTPSFVYIFRNYFDDWILFQKIKTNDFIIGSNFDISNNNRLVFFVRGEKKFKVKVAIFENVGDHFIISNCINNNISTNFYALSINETGDKIAVIEYRKIRIFKFFQNQWVYDSELTFNHIGLINSNVILRNNFLVTNFNFALPGKKLTVYHYDNNNWNLLTHFRLFYVAAFDFRNNSLIFQSDKTKVFDKGQIYICNFE